MPKKQDKPQTAYHVVACSLFKGGKLLLKERPPTCKVLLARVY